MNNKILEEVILPFAKRLLEGIYESTFWNCPKLENK
jgi:hypothetical protein